jgi:hypothetical protein
MNRSLTLTFIFSIFIAAISYAQPTIQWQKCYGTKRGDGITDIKQTPDGGYIMIGSVDTADGDVSSVKGTGTADIWVVKLSSTGAIQWEKTYGGTALELPGNIELTSDGGYIFIGGTRSNDGDVTGNHGLCDAWVVKLTSTGTITWQKTYGGTAEDAYGYGSSIPAIKVGANNDYYFAVVTASTDGDVTGHHGGVDDFWACRISSTGALLWQKAIGGSSIDFATSIAASKNGGCLVTGTAHSSNGDIVNSHTPLEAWVSKLDTSGNITWKKSYGGSKSDGAWDIIETKDGGYAMTGYTNSTDGDVTGYHDSGDVFTVKIDSAGNFKWSHTCGGNRSETAYGISQGTGDIYLTAGMSLSANGNLTTNKGINDMILTCLYHNGTLKWVMSVGGSKDDRGRKLIETADGGYLAAGITNSTDGDATGNGFHLGPVPNYTDIWLVKLNSTSAITDVSENPKVSVYPTITTGDITIATQQQHNSMSVKLVNMYGIEVGASKGDDRLEQTIQFNESLPPGVYFLQVQIDGKPVGTYRVIYQP